jgi:hypothetical protein
MSRRFLLCCGILSSLLYVAMNVVVAMQWERYSSASQTVSELSAIGAPTRPLWVLLGIVYTSLMAAFGWGLRASAGRNRHLRRAGVLLVAYGVIGFVWSLAPMHLRGSEATLTDIMHIVLAVVTVLLMLFAIGFAAAALGRRFRLYSIAATVILVAFGVLTGVDGLRIAANLPTPWVGVWERISIGAFLLWVIVLAIARLRTEQRSVRATLGESTQLLPGDELISQPIGSLTHAITISRPPRDVWPWLAQMGAGSRAGWYSYDYFDKAGRPSATQVIPDLQHLSVGVLFPALRGATDGFRLLAFEPERFLILGGHSPDDRPLMTWTFVLQSTEVGATRLIVRVRAGSGYQFQRLPWWLGRRIVRLVHFAMQRRQLLGIANRVECASANELDPTSRENRSAA